MPKPIRITKELILETAFEIAREKGLEGVSNREIAKKLKCSIRPIYYQFENVEELNNELYRKIEKYFYKFITDNMTKDMPEYKQVGINYIKFAKAEKKLFQILFMSKTKLGPDMFISKAGEDYESIQKIIKKSTKLKDEEIKSFHTKMWMFTHGIATLVAAETLELSLDQIKELLSHEFQALMLLEENPDNKWVLSKRKNID